MVRSESLPSTPNDKPGQATSNSRPITPQHTPAPAQSPLLAFDRTTTPDPLQQRLVNSLVVASNIMDSMNRRDDFRPIAVAPTTRASPPISQSPIRAQSSSLQGSTSSNGSAGNTIEELLIQINENLSKQDDLHGTATLSQHHLPKQPLSLSPTALKQALSTEVCDIT